MRPTRGVSRLAAPVSAVLSMIATALVAAGAAAQPTAARTLSLSQCVAIALRENPDAQSSEFAVHGAEAQRAEVQGAFAPKVQFDGNVQQWSSPFNIAFGPPGSQPITVRNAFTWSAGVSLIQPITALLPIYQQYKIQDFGVDVAAIRRAATRREVAFHTIESYYRLLEAERLADVASASVTQLEAQQTQAQSQFDNGLIGKNDLLRATLALASARQRAIQADGQVVLARGQLATAMGRSPDEAMEPEPFSSEPPPLSESGLEAAEGRAAAGRLELRDLARQVDQAQLGVSYAKAKLGPVVNAVGNYTHSGGQPFQQENAAYVGLAASWNVWDWGTTLGGVHEADAKLQQAILARKKLEDAVRLEARQAFVNAESSRQALEVARTAVSQAEENFRIVTKKFENNAATSFDVVDAEALLTQSRGQVEQALYDYLIAAAALQKATGAALPGEGT
jgi:outer membrane protein TolC